MSRGYFPRTGGRRKFEPLLKPVKELAALSDEMPPAAAELLALVAEAPDRIASAMLTIAPKDEVGPLEALGLVESNDRHHRTITPLGRQTLQAGELRTEDPSAVTSTVAVIEEGVTSEVKALEQAIRIKSAQAVHVKRGDEAARNNAVADEISRRPNRGQSRDSTKQPLDRGDHGSPSIGV